LAVRKGAKLEEDLGRDKAGGIEGGVVDFGNVDQVEDLG